MKEADILKSNPHREAGSRGGRKTWHKIREMEVDNVRLCAENKKLTQLMNELMVGFLKFDL